MKQMLFIPIIVLSLYYNGHSQSTDKHYFGSSQSICIDTNKVNFYELLTLDIAKDFLFEKLGHNLDSSHNYFSEYLFSSDCKKVLYKKSDSINKKIEICFRYNREFPEMITKIYTLNERTTWSIVISFFKKDNCLTYKDHITTIGISEYEGNKYIPLPVPEINVEKSKRKKRK